MCLILFAYDIHPDYRLILAANRDEFYDRPSAPAGFWDEDPSVLAGRDLQAGGTWFGVTRTGRFAGLTNYRDPKSVRNGAPSRGLLVSRSLMSDEDPCPFLKGLLREANDYNGFNLLLGTGKGLYWYSNRGEGVRRLAPGLYGLSNHLLDTPWPKVERGKSALNDLISEAAMPEPDAFFRMLEDCTQAPDSTLPDTGIGLERERMLSPVFIESPDYGTCASTLLFMGRDNSVIFMERRFSRGKAPVSSERFDFYIDLKMKD